MSKARQLADLGNVYDDGALSNRNLIINGAMQVAQRATSVSAQTAAGYYVCDRFVTEASGCTFDVEQSSTAPDGFVYSLKVTMDGAFTPTSSQYLVPFEQRIEGNNLQRFAYGTSSAKSMTLSFWIKSNKTGTYVIDLRNSNSSQQRGQSKSYTVSSADTWEYKTLTFVGDTSYAFDTGTSAELTLYWWMTAGTTFTAGSLADTWQNLSNENRAVGVASSVADNDYWQITGVQLEVGDTATPFEHRSYGDELARCQRYFQTWGSVQTFASGVWFASNQVLAHMPYHKEMRASPTFSTSGSTFAKVYRGGGTIQVSDSSPFDIINTTSARANLSFGSAGTSGHGAMCQTESSAYIHADAEL